MESKKVKRLVERRHPRYDEMVRHWDFLEKSYEGGRAWFKDNVFRYMKEGDKEFADRLERAYRFNHAREVVDLVNKYLFRSKIIRNEDAPQHLKDFWKSATLRGLSMDEFMGVVSTKSSAVGCPWIVVDSDLRLEEGASEADAEAAKANSRGVYAYMVKPQDVLDMGYDEKGELNWILIRETVRDDDDPIESTGDVSYRYRLWKKNSWSLFRKDGRTYKKIGEGDTDLGEVPVVRADNVFSADPYVATALIADVAYLDRAVANYLSNLDAIIQDQTFSQLAMPAQGIMPGDDVYKKILEMGTKRIFIYDGESGAAPAYLSPDPRQANLIIAAIQQLINEIYHSVGLAGERTKQDNAKGIDNSSGVAKKADFDRVLALLKSKSASLETVENKVAHLVSLWSGVTSQKEEFVDYPETFDVRDLQTELEIAASVQTLDLPSRMVAEELKILGEKLFPGAKKELIEKLRKEIDEWAREKDEAVDFLANKLNPSDQIPTSPRNTEDEAEKQSESKASSD